MAGSSTQDDTLAGLIEAIGAKDPDIAEAMKIICKKYDNEVVGLKNEITQLKNRMTQTERYNSKDCVIIHNMPITSTTNITEQAIKFIKDYFDIQLTFTDIKACHFLGNCKDFKNPKPIIIKFVFFQHKNDVWYSKKLLKGKRHANGYFISMTERLPQVDLEVKQYAEQKNLLVFTNNCAVKLKMPNPQGGFYTQEVQSTNAVDRMINKGALPRINLRPQHSRPQLPSGGGNRYGTQFMAETARQVVADINAKVPEEDIVNAIMAAREGSPVQKKHIQEQHLSSAALEETS